MKKKNLSAFTRLVKPLARIWTRAKAYWLGCTRNPRKPSFASAHSYGACFATGNGLARLRSASALGRKAAFTLAEVLITLTILGVVAAIALPSLNERSSQKQNIVKYRKTVAALNNAFELYKLEVDSRGFYNLVTSDSTKFYTDFFKKYFNTTPLKSENWVNDYTDYIDYNGHKGIKYMNGTSVTSSIPRKHIVRLKDGVEIRLHDSNPQWVKSTVASENILRLRGTSTTNMGVDVGDVMIDVNGEKKGPNVVGKDIFWGELLLGGYYPLPLESKYYFTFYNTVVANKGKLSEKCTKKSTGVNCSSWFLTHNDYDK